VTVVTRRADEKFAVSEEQANALLSSIPEIKVFAVHRAAPRKASNMRKTTLAALGAVVLVGCAPDQFSNYKATGFNGFVDMASVECAPLQVGPMVITKNYEPPNYATGQYGVWLDQTSNLYYKRITPEAYIENINNLFPGERTARATQCLVSKLPPPAERPSAPR